MEKEILIMTEDNLLCETASVDCQFLVLYNPVGETCGTNMEEWWENIRMKTAIIPDICASLKVAEAEHHGSVQEIYKYQCMI